MWAQQDTPGSSHRVTVRTLTSPVRAWGSARRGDPWADCHQGLGCCQLWELHQGNPREPVSTGEQEYPQTPQGHAARTPGLPGYPLVAGAMRTPHPANLGQQGGLVASCEMPIGVWVSGGLSPGSSSAAGTCQGRE